MSDILYAEPTFTNMAVMQKLKISLINFKEFLINFNNNNNNNNNNKCSPCQQYDRVDHIIICMPNIHKRTVYKVV